MNSPDHLSAQQPAGQSVHEERPPDPPLPEQNLCDHFRDHRREHSRDRSGTATALGTDVIGSLQSLLGTVVIAVFVITFIVQAFQIPSPSMENTLLVGDYLLVDKLCYGGGSLGDNLMPYRRGQRDRK